VILIHVIIIVIIIGGIRPTAIGYTLRRIAAKCANSYTASQLAYCFSPIQLEVRTHGSYETTVYATRRYNEALPDRHVVVVKIDFRNAFNSLRRVLMLRSVASAVPGICRFCCLSYNQPSVFRF